jgi:hypothetical protein
VLDIDLVLLARLELAHHLGELVVAVGCLLGLARDDQRGAGLVDQDVVDLVDDRVDQVALDHPRGIGHHVVAQVVEAELVVGAVGDVGAVRLLSADRPELFEPLILADPVGVEEEGGLVLDDADAKAEAVVNLPHPLGIALGKVVVDRHDMHAAPGQRVQRHRERCRQRLALAGSHLSDLAGVKHGTADELDVVVALAEAAEGHLAGRGERLGQEIVDGLAGVDPASELRGKSGQLLVGTGPHRRFEVVDLRHDRLERLDRRLVRVAEQLDEQFAHEVTFASAAGRAGWKTHLSHVTASIRGQRRPGRVAAPVHRTSGSAIASPVLPWSDGFSAFSPTLCEVGGQGPEHHHRHCPATRTRQRAG